MSRTSRISSGGRVSRLASSCPKDFEFELFVYQNEVNYNIWWSSKRMLLWVRGLSDDTMWNCFICCLTLVGLLQVAADIIAYDPWCMALDIIYNIIYAGHALFMFFERVRQAMYENTDFTGCMKYGFVADVLSYIHYITLVLPPDSRRPLKLVCYYIRLHTPFEYLWALTSSNLKGSVLGTAFKYFYIFIVMRVTCALIWIKVREIQSFFQTFWHLFDSAVPGHVIRNVTDNTTKSKVFVARELPILRDIWSTTVPNTAAFLNATMALTARILSDVATNSTFVETTTTNFSLASSMADVYSLSKMKLVDTYSRAIQKDLTVRDDTETGKFIRAVYIINTMFMPIGPTVNPSNDYERVTCLFIMVIGSLVVSGAAVASLALVISLYMRPEEVFRARFRLVMDEMASTHVAAEMRDKVETFYRMYWLKQKAVSITQLLPTFPPTLPNAIYTDIYFEAQQRSQILRDLSYQFLWELAKNMVTIHYIPGDSIIKRKAEKSSVIYIAYGDIEMLTAEDDDTPVLRMTRGTMISPCGGCAPMACGKALVEIRAATYCTAHVLTAANLWRVALKHGKTNGQAFIIFSSFEEHFERVKRHYRGRVSPDVKYKSSILQFKQNLMALKEAKDDSGNLLMSRTDFFLEIAGTYIMRNKADATLADEADEICLRPTFPCILQPNSSLLIFWHVLMAILILIVVFVHPFYIVFADTIIIQFKFFDVVVSGFFILDMIIHLSTGANVEEGVAITFTQTCTQQIQSYWFFLDVLATLPIFEFVSEGEWAGINKLLRAPKVFRVLKTLEDMSVYHSYILRFFSYTLFTIIASYFFASIHQAYMCLKEDYISTINDVKTFLVRNNVDSMLRKRFITYLSLCWHTDKAYSMTHKKSIFFDLPPHVYQDIVAKQRIKYILCVPFMKYLRPEDLKLVSAQTRIFYTSPNEILQNTGDIGNEIFIIKQGICQLYDPDSKKPIRRISVKDSFGILECLLRFPAFYTVSAVTHVQLLTVPNKYLQNALRVPRLIDAIDYAKEQDEYARSQMRREPFLNYENPPPTKSIYRFPLLRKFEPDTAFMQPFTRLGFFSILRYVFPRFTIRPDGNYIYRYEWFRALCALASSLIYPSYTYMVLQVPQLYYITSTLDFLAYIDIIQRMLVGYYNEEGILVSHPASTAAHYLKGAFLVDLFGSVPLEKLETRIVNTSVRVLHELNPIVQLLMFNRIIQLYRLPGAMDIVSTFIEREDILLMIKAMPIFLVMINVLTCAMIFCSVEILTDIRKSSWFIVPDSDYGGSWLSHFKDSYRFNITESPWNLQLTVFSWTVYEVTTTGYNIFQPSNSKLIWILYLGMLLGGMMTTYFAVRVISIRANVNKMLANFQEHMKDITQYMEKEKLRSKLQTDVIAYYEYNWEKTGGTDYRNVLKLCDQITLRTDAILHLYGHTFAKCPILYHCDLSLLRVVGRAVFSQYFLNETTIISKGELVSDMYFVDYGTVDVRESKEILRTEARLPRGSVFGNLENTSAICSPTDIVATAHCHLLQINTLMFYDIILDFPTVKVLLSKYRPKKENYIIGGIGEGSSLMNQWKEHRTPSSPTIVVSRKGVSNYFNINSRACQTYLIIVSLIVVYLDIYNAGFQANTLILIIFLYFLDIAFALKIPLSYIQPYVVVKGEQRIALSENRKIYFKSEFYYDLLSCLPFEVFCLTVAPSDKWRIFSLLRLNRLLRVATIQSCLKRHQAKLNINLVLSTIVAVSIWFSLFVHTTSCLWYSVGVYEDKIKPQSSWMYKDSGDPHCLNQYVCSVYMILTTFAHKGVGDIMAKKPMEVVFMTILEIVSTMMFMIYVGEFSNIIQYQSFRSFAYYCKFLELQDFLSNNRVSKNLVELVSRYSLHLWRESRGVQIPYFLEKAPPCFKLKIMSAAYMHHLIMNPSFKDCEPAFLRQLVGCLTLFRYNTDLFVVREGEITDSMYLIHNGRVVEIDEDMDEETNEFLPGTHFGQMQGLIRDTPFNYSYKTTSKAEVLTLSLDNWENLLAYFPISRYSIFKSYPNHPYSRHPNDEPQQQKDKLYEEKKRQMMARRKTEHELKSMPVPMGKRDVSPSESESYRPFYTPPSMTSTGTTPKTDTGASKALGAKSGVDVISEEPAAAVPASKMATATPTDTKVPAATEPTTEMPATLLASTKGMTSTGTTPKTDSGASKALEAKPAADVISEVPAAAVPASKMATTTPTNTKVPAATEPTTEMPATKLASTKGPTDIEPTTQISATKVTAAKAPDSKTATSKVPAAALAAVAGGTVVTGAAVAGVAALAAPSVPKDVPETENKSALISGSGITSPAASKPTLIEPKEVSELKLKQLKDTLTSTLEIPESGGAKEGRMMPRPTATVKQLQAELQGEAEEEPTFSSLPDTRKPKGTDNRLEDDTHSAPSSLKTEIVPSLSMDEREQLLPGRGKTRTEIFDTLEETPRQTDENKPTQVSNQSNDQDTRSNTIKVKDKTDGSMTRLSDQVSTNTYVAELLSPSIISESKSVAIPVLDEDEIEDLENIDILQIKDESVVPMIPETIVPQFITPVESKTPAETSVLPSDNRSEQQASEVPKVSPVVNQTSPIKSPSGLSRSESVLRTDVSLPYFEYDSDDDKKEEKRVSEEYEEAPKSFMRRMTQHAKRFIGRPSIAPEKQSGETKALEQDIKATSALLQKYEERSKKSKAPDDGEKSLLAQYIEKRNAELATAQKEESEEEFIRQAPRRSIVVFGDEESPPVRTIPIEQPDDDEEAAKISRAPRRSVVIFDSQGKSPLRVLPEEINYDSDEHNEQETVAVYEPNKNTSGNNATAVNLDSETQSPSGNVIDRSLEENYQNKGRDISDSIKKNTGLPFPLTDESKDKNNDTENILEDPKPNPNDATEFKNVSDGVEAVLKNPKSTDAAELTNIPDDNIIATETKSATQSSTTSSSNIKKPSLIQKLFRKKKPEGDNKPENKAQSSSATAEGSDINDEDYESKLVEDDEWLTEKRMPNVGDKGKNVDLPVDDDGFNEGHSKPLPPQRKLSDVEQIKDTTEDEKKLMDSDKDKQNKKTD